MASMIVLYPMFISGVLLGINYGSPHIISPNFSEKIAINGEIAEMASSSWSTLCPHFQEEPAELSTGADDDSLSAFDEVGFLDGSQSKEPAAMDHWPALTMLESSPASSLRLPRSFQDTSGLSTSSGMLWTIIFFALKIVLICFYVLGPFNYHRFLFSFFLNGFLISASASGSGLERYKRERDFSQFDLPNQEDPHRDVWHQGQVSRVCRSHWQPGTLQQIWAGTWKSGVANICKYCKLVWSDCYLPLNTVWLPNLSLVLLSLFSNHIFYILG